MKLVFLAPFGIRPKGTLQARVLPLAKEMLRLGHEVVVIAPPYTNPEDSGLVEQIDGITIRNVLLGPATGFIAAPFISLRMLKAALEQEPDIIHLFKPKGYGGLAALALLLLRMTGVQIPLLVIDSDDREGIGGMNELHPYSWFEKRLFAFQEKYLIRWSDGVTVASRTLETLAWGMGANRADTLYLPNGPLKRSAGDRLRGREYLGLPLDAPVLLLYTRFFEFSQQRLYNVLERLCKKLPAVRILVVGKGMAGEEKSLEQAAIRSGLRGNIVCAGWQEPDNLSDCIAAADAAIYPFDDTLVNRAKCPAKLAELAAAGLPITAERVGQINEYLIHNESALLVESGDAAALADAAYLLLTDRELASRLGASAFKRLSEQFGWEIAASKLDRFYEGLRRYEP